MRVSTLQADATPMRAEDGDRSAFRDRQVQHALSWIHRQAAPGARLRVDSRSVQPGDIFLALAGQQHHGAAFIGQAFERGASAVLCADDTPPLGPAAAPVDAAPWSGWAANPKVLLLRGLQDFLGQLAAFYYGHPSRRVPLVAVTGTNGKTSIAHWIAAHWGAPAAAVGTLGARLFQPGTALAPAVLTDAGATTVLTSPEAVILQGLLERIAEGGAQLAAIEASSIGLHQHRLQGCAPAVAVYTQLSRDHLDYHGTMQAYARAKSSLFGLLGQSPWGAHAVVQLDDAFTPTMLRACTPGTALHFYSMDEDLGRACSRAQELAESCRASKFPDPGGSKETPNPCGKGIARAPDSSEAKSEFPSAVLLWARLLESAADNTSSMQLGWCYLAIDRSSARETASGVQGLSLLGRFNALNALAVAATWIALGRPIGQALAALSELRPVEGRMERLGGNGVPLVVVDYAHTPDALEQVLLALRPVASRRQGQLICVVGAGGDRDPGKRPLIGAVAARHADRVCFTSDNPRREDPARILAEVAGGAHALEPSAEVDRPPGRAARCVESMVDRAAAIDRVLAEAAPEDLVLIAGKGHERYQEIHGQRLPFDDREHAAAALARHWTLA